MSKVVLVTGGAGYIGSHACKELHRAGYSPVAFDNLVFGHEWAVKWGPLVRADLSDLKSIRRTLSEYSVEAVLHFAAFAYVGESMQNPLRYFQNNVANTINLLGAMREEGVDQMVFSSSCATYGVPRTDKIREDHPQAPVNPYGESKLMVEKILRWQTESHGLRSVILRYFNAAGADLEYEIGEDHTPETHLIPLAVKAAMGHAPALNVFGWDYPTRDGTCIRDYVHVADLASAHVKALQYLEAGEESTSVNLGTGQGNTVAEVISSVERISGRQVPRKRSPRRAGDPASLVADAGRARSILGWTPRHSELETMVLTAYEWEKRLTDRKSQASAAPESEIIV